MRTGWREIDVAELSLPATMRTHFPDPEDILNFELKIEPDEGTTESFWGGGVGSRGVLPRVV